MQNRSKPVSGQRTVVRTSQKDMDTPAEGLRKEVENLLDVAPAGEPGGVGSPSKTPITALLSSIQQGFLFTPSSPLSPPQAYLPVASMLPEQLKNHVVVSGLPGDASPDAPFCRSLKQDFMIALDRRALEAVDLN
ncbi:hypothetical protein BU15DRAFT_71196 [Melanogaster broomeanus]|nr:hypothetical protein BU15DRAFT_71196 [Melanogaster broomeanus]